MDENAVKLLFTYGPFALLILFLFVVEAKVRGALKDTSVPSKVSVPIYCATWVVIFALCGAVVYIWILFNVTREATIAGTFSNIGASQSVSSRYNLYLHRSYNTGDSFDYDWRLVTPHPIAQGTKVDFDFAASPTAIPTRHPFSIEKSFYDSPVAIRYVSRTQKLVLEHDGKTTELPSIDDNTRMDLPDSTPGFGLMPVVFAAQAGPSSRSMVKASRATVYERLDAVDPVIRRDARYELIALGKEELPRMEQHLVADKSSIRLRVGVLSAINAMKGLDDNDLENDAYLAIVRAASSPDSSLANEAYLFFARHSVAGALELPPEFGGAATRNVEVKAADPARGHFMFAFSLVRQGGGAVLIDLKEIDVIRDSSLGSTRWMFSVLANQQDAFQLLNRRYDEKPGQAKYSLTPADKASAVVRVDPGQNLTIRVIGYKPKNLPKTSTFQRR